MKSNVVEFPTIKARSNSKVAEYERKMINLAKMLDVRYEHLHDLAVQYGEIEAECEKFEKQYETLLKAYAERIGPQNVSIKFYDYSSEIGIEFCPDQNTFFIDNVDRTKDHKEHIQPDDKSEGDTTA